MRMEIFKGIFAYIEKDHITNNMICTVTAEGSDIIVIEYAPGEMTLKKLQKDVAKILWEH